MSAQTTPRYEDVLVRQREGVTTYAGYFFDECVDRLSSPIEKVFLGEMLSHWWIDAHGGDERTFDRAYTEVQVAGLMPWINKPRMDDGVMTFVQRMHREDHFPIAITQPGMEWGDSHIVPDFAFILPGEHATRIIVELDGHDFHERTPEQAQKDKSRDRELQAKGWHVLRFTGREVLRDPWLCLNEVETLLRAKAVLARQKEREAEK